MRNAKTYVPQLLCPQPTKESDQTAFFLRNALTLVPRNNLARYRHLRPAQLDGEQMGPEEMLEKIRQLQKENEYLKRQREILKKAMSILGEEPHSGMR